jgi:hypothetical protein
MAIDNTPPRLRLIVTIAVIVVITLITLDFVFKSYYAFMSDEAQREKLAPLTARDEQRAAEQAAFAGAKVPLDQAMTQLKGARGELVEPKPSEDMAPMTGWAKLPKPPPIAAPAPLHAPEMPVVSGDGGAAMAADAGAAPKGGPAAKDAGAPAPHAPQH